MVQDSTHGTRGTMRAGPEVSGRQGKTIGTVACWQEVREAGRLLKIREKEKAEAGPSNVPSTLSVGKGIVESGRSCEPWSLKPLGASMGETGQKRGEELMGVPGAWRQ